MQSDTYLKDAVDRVLEVIKDTLGNTFKTYFNGIPDEFETSMLPCIAATTESGEIAAGATGTDLITETVVLLVVLNTKDYMGANASGMPNDTQVAASDLALRRMVYAQNPTNNEYLEQTIMYALRRFFTLSEYIFTNRISFDFTPVRRNEDLFTQEATITFKLERMALVPVRN